MDKEHVFYLDEQEVPFQEGQMILEAAREAERSLPGICYHPQLGGLQTCDLCLVEVDGEWVRACTTLARPGMKVVSQGEQVEAAQYEAMSRVLQNHELYCTVCDNNNGNCEVHNTALQIQLNHQEYDFEPKPDPPEIGRAHV